MHFSNGTNTFEVKNSKETLEERYRGKLWEINFLFGEGFQEKLIESCFHKKKMREREIIIFI